MCSIVSVYPEVEQITQLCAEKGALCLPGRVAKQDFFLLSHPDVPSEEERNGAREVVG